MKRLEFKQISENVEAEKSAKKVQVSNFSDCQSRTDWDDSSI